jgi:hypothetical protein
MSYRLCWRLASKSQHCKLRYDTIPVKSASANVSFYTSKSKKRQILICDTLVASERYQGSQNYSYIKLQLLRVPFFFLRERRVVTYLRITPTFSFITSSSSPTSPQESSPLCCRNSYRKCHVVIPLFCSLGMKDYENPSSTGIIRNTCRRKS